MRNPGAAGLYLIFSLLFAVPGLAAPTTPDLATASDSGSSDTDNITNVALPTFVGTAAAGDTVTLASDVDGALGSTTADGTTGAYSLTLAAALSDGVHQITAEESSDAGNPSGSLSVTIDTASPAAPSTPDLDTTSDTGSSSTDNLTSDTTPLLTGTAEVGSTVTLTSDQSVPPIGTGTAGGGSFSIVSSALSQATHQITATATDVAGNVSLASATLSITIDTTSPNAPTTPDLLTGDDSGSSDTDNITNDASPSFTGTADAGITVEIRTNQDVTVWSGTATGGNYTIATALSENTHQVTAVAIDPAGNEASSGALQVIVDRTAPSPSTPDLDAGSDTGDSSTDNLTGDDTPRFTGSGAESGSTVVLSSDVQGVLETATADGSGGYDITVTAGNALSLGDHDISVTATDLAGNEGSSEALTITVGVDLAVAVSGFPVAPVPGTEVSYAVEVTKNGPGTVTEIELTGVIANGLLNPVVTVSEGFLLPLAPSPQWRDLALGASPATATATVTGIIDPGMTGAFAVAPSGAVPGVTDIGPGNNDPTATSTLTPLADLQVVKSNNINAVSPGDEITWSITVTNLGPSDVDGATLIDDLPELLLDPDPTAGTCGSGPFVDYLEFDVDNSLNSSAELAISPDGRHVYAAGSPVNSVVAFSRDPATFALTVLDAETGLADLEGASSVAVSPDGRHVYVTGATAGNVVIFDRDANSASPGFGELTYSSTYAGSVGAFGLVVSPDGRNLYVASGAVSDRLDVLTRDPATGGLTSLESFSDGSGGITRLDGARSVAISPDGLRVYVAATDDDAVVVFDRAPVDGSLTFDEERFDGGVDASGDAIIGLSGVVDLALSPDGLDIYLTSPIDAAVVSFRDTGDLEYTPSPATITSVRSIAVTSDGERVIATSFGTPGAVTAFERAADGSLSVVAVFSSQDEGGTPTFEGLDLAAGLVLGPEGRSASIGGVTFAPAASVASLVLGRRADCTDANPAVVALGAGVDVNETMDLEAGGSVVVGITARIAEGSTSNILDNTAYVVAPAGVADPAPSAGQPTVPYPCPSAGDDNNCSTDSDPINRVADISVVKTASATAIPGDATSPLVYTIEVRNNGPESTAATVAKDITFTDNLPTDLFSQWSWYCTASGGASCPAGTGSAASPVSNADIGAHVFDLPANAAAKLVFTVTAVLKADAAAMTADLEDCPSGPADRCVFNQATVVIDPAGAYGDPDTSNNGDAIIGNGDSGEAFTEVVSTADLTILKTGRFLPADPLSLRDLDFAPILGAPLVGSTLYDLFTGATGIIQNVDGTTITLSEVQGAFNDGDILYSPGSTDPTFPFFFYASANGPDGPSAGAVARAIYAITVTNLGPSDVVGASFNDTLPAGIRKDPPSSITWSCDPLSACTPSSGTLDIVGLSVDLEAGESVVINIDGVLDVSPPPVLVNTATIDPPAGTVDPTTPNSSTNELVLVAEGDLAITKNDGTAEAIPGEEITYSLVVTNNGPEDLFGVTVIDPLPPQILDARWTCSAKPPLLGSLQFLDAVGQTGVVGGGDIAMSPDDRHVYAAMGTGNALVVYRRVTADGADFGNLDPDPVQVLEDGVSGLSGLADAASVVVSPDGRHVYAVGRGAGAVLVFARDRNQTSSDFGKLSLLQAFQGPAGNLASPIAGAVVVEGLDGAGAAAVSPDGVTVYVGGATVDKALVVFGRDGATGLLSRIEIFQDDSATPLTGAVSVSGLDGLVDLTVSPGGEHLYAAAAADSSLVVFTRDGVGRLTAASLVEDGVTAGVDDLGGVSSVVVSPDGAHAYTAAPDDNAITFFNRNAASGALSFAAVYIDGVDGDGFAGVTSVAIAPEGQPLAPDGQHLYAAGSDSNAIAVFRRSTVTGGLSFFDSVANNDPVLDGDGNSVGTVNGLGNVVSVMVSSDGRSVYGLGRQFGTVAALSRNGSPPLFTFDGAVFDGDIQGAETVRGLRSATSVAVTPIVGTHVYATGLADDAVVIFQRNVSPSSPDYGALTFLEVLQDDDSANPITGATLVDGLLGASNLAISPDGRFVYVTSRDESALVVFSRGNDPSDMANFGRLTRTAVFQDDDGNADDPVLGATVVNGLFGALGVVADNQYVYVAGPFDAGIAAFARGGAGNHTFIGAKLNGPGSGGAGGEAVEGLQGASALALTGSHLYAVGAFEDSVVAFTRDPSSGGLTFLDVWRDGQSGIDGLDRALGIAVSGDGEHVYVTGAFDNALAVFRRDTLQGPPSDPNRNFGRLDFLQVLRDGDNIGADEEGAGVIDGLAGARSVTVSRDGSRVYVAGENDGAFTVFTRNEDVANPNFGTLRFVETSKDGIGNIDGLDQAYAVAVSPDDRHIYLAGLGDNAIAVFFRNRSSSCSASGTGDIRDAIDIAAGGTVTYTLTGTIDPSATGDLSNTAFVLPCRLGDDGTCSTTNASDPFGGRLPVGCNPVTDPSCVPAIAPYDCPTDGSDNNCSVDTDVLTPRGDVGLTKTNSQSTVVPGEDVTYTLVVDNDGPSNVTGARVLDDLSGIFELDEFGDPIVEWTCQAIPTGRLDFIESVADGALGIAALESPYSAAVSTDGSHVYTTSLVDDAVTVFERNGLDGALTPIQVIDSTTVAALDGPSAVAVSPGGRWVYVTAQVADALLVFERENDPTDPAFGTLTLSDAETHSEVDGDSGLTVTGLDQPLAVAVSVVASSPVDDYVFVAAANSDSVAAFAQHDDGTLHFIESDVNGESNDPESMPRTVSGLGGASGVAVSPDGSHLYVAAKNDGSVAWFSIGPDGRLSWQDERNALLVPELAGATSIAVAPDPDLIGPLTGGDHVYVVSESENALVAFSRNTTGGELSHLETLVDDEDGVAGLGGARSVALSDDGVNLYVASRVDGALAVFARDFDNSSADFGRLTFVETKRDGFGGVDGLRGAVSVALSSDGRSVYAAGQSDGQMAVFGRAANTRCGSTSGTGSLDVLADIASGAEVVFTITGTVQPDLSGTLTNTAEVQTPPGLDPNGDNNTDGDTDDLRPRADLEITKTDGLISVDGIGGVSGLFLSPDERHLYAAGRTDSAVAVFVRNADPGSPGYGGLAFLEALLDNQDGVDGLNGASAITGSGDGRNVYAVSDQDNAVVVFQRDDDSGRLTLLETEFNNRNGVSGLLRASAVAVSPDGEQVFVTGAGQGTLAVFNREDDPESASIGALTLNQVIANGDAQDSLTVDGLAGARAVAISANDATVYVAGSDDAAIAVFDRDPTTELLTFRQVVGDGDTLAAATVNGLAGVRGLVLVDAMMYVVGDDPGAVAVFERDPSSGEIVEQLQVIANGDVHGALTVDGLSGASAVAASADGQRIYVAGAAEDAVAVFERLPDGRLGFVAVVSEGNPTAVEGLGAPKSLITSAGHLYAGGSATDSIAVFDRLVGAPELDFVEAEYDGGGGAAPGDPITYTMIVTNNGPSQVDDNFGAGGGALVIDSLPLEITGVSWSCTNLNPELTPVGFTVCGSTSGVGDIDLRLGLPTGVSVRIEATGTIRPDATGGLSNTATVAVPSGVLDPDQNNNTATDDDTGLGRLADLVVEKISCVREDGQIAGIDDYDTCVSAGTGVLVPGDEVAYWISVDNDGPSDASQVSVRDVFPEAVNQVEWECLAEPIPGLLDLVEVEVDGGDAEAIDGAGFVAVSPDGRHVYVAGTGDDAIAVFRRSAGPGLLDLVAEVRNGDDHGSGDDVVLVDGLQGVGALALSPDGGSLYAASPVSDSIVLFERDPVSGELTFVALWQDNVNAVDGLGGVSDILVTSDGAHLYAAGQADDAVAAFARSGANGELTFLGVYRDGDATGDSTVSGLIGPVDLATGDDGDRLYAASAGAGQLVIFDREPADGELTFASTIADGDPGANGPTAGMFGIRAVATAGGDVYAVSPGTDLVTHLRWDSEGEVLVHIDSQTAPTGAAGPVAVAVSSDGYEVYVAGATDSGIAVFARSTTTGGLAPVGSVLDTDLPFGGLAGVSSIVLSPGSAHLYAAAPDDNAVSVFDRLTGSRCTASGTGHILDTASIVNDGRVVYRASGRIGSGARGTLVNTATAEPGRAVSDPDLTFNTSETRDDLVPAADLAVSKVRLEPEVIPGLDVTYVVTVTNNGPSDVAGATAVDSPPIFEPGIETAGLIGSSVEWQCVEDTALQFIDALRDGDVAGLTVSGLDEVLQAVVTADGRNVYTVSRNTGAVSIFDRDPLTGELEFVQSIVNGDDSEGAEVEGLAMASGIALSPDDQHIYVTGHEDDAVVAFTRVSDPEEADFGRLIFLEALFDGVDTVFGLDGAASIAVAPDGRHVFVASDEGDALAVFARDDDEASDDFGSLTWVERQKDGFGDLPLGILNGASVVAVSPDDEHVVVGSNADDSLAVFSRAEDGRLTLVQVLKDDGAATSVPGETVVNGLDYPSGLAFGPVGRHLYVTSLADDALAIFDRDSDPASDGFGTLAQSQIFVNGLGGATMLNGARDVAVSPDGATVIVAARNEDALTVYRRDAVNDSPTFGMLQQVGAIIDGQNTAGGGSLTQVDGLDAVSSVQFTGDGRHVYVTSAVGDAVALFTPSALSYCGAFEGAGAILETIDLEAGATVTYTVGGRLHPSARGSLINIAEVSNPAGVPEPADGNPADNEDSDDGEPAVLTPVANLTIVKTNNQLTSVKGIESTYTITVSNAGPSDALGAAVGDLFTIGTSGFVAGSVDWTCAATSGSLCTPAGDGDIADSVVVLAGGNLVYTARATVHPNASGDIINTASVVSEPPPASDPDPSDNSSTDVDGVVTVTDLAIAKTNSSDEVIRGGTVTWDVTVTNLGPSFASQVEVSDVFPAALLNGEWSCISNPPATCGAGGPQAMIDDLADLPPGASLVYQVTGDVDQSASGLMVNTASVAPSVADTDPNLSNNQATDSDEIVTVSDLSITKTNNADVVFKGDSVTYIVTVTNHGPSDATQAQVSDTFPPEMLDPDWSCDADTGASCGSGGMLASIDDTVDLPASTSVTYTVTATVDPETEAEELVNTATVVAAVPDEDRFQPDNEATDSDPIEDPVIFSDGFESGDTSAWSAEATKAVELILEDPAAGAGAAIGPDRGLEKFRVRFRFEAVDTTIGEGSSQVIASGRDAQAAGLLFELEFGRHLGEDSVRVVVYDQRSVEQTSDWVGIGGGSHWIEMLWWSKSGEMGEGGFRLWVDDRAAADFSNLDTAGARLHRMLVGPVANPEGGDRGTLVFDQVRWTTGAMLQSERKPPAGGPR